MLGTAGWTSESPRTTGAVRERWESLSALASLADESAAALGDSLSAFVAELDGRAELQHAPVADAVTLASIHSAKGLEWRIVLVIGCSDGLLPLQYAETPAQVEEERRLAYVAITRAADRLHLSWARARQPGGRQTRAVSPFILEAAAGLGVPADAVRGGVVQRGSGQARAERPRTGPGRCRVCRKGLVTAEERTLGRCRSCPADLNEELLAALHAWRLEQSRARGVPVALIFTDVTLVAVAEQRPLDADSLAEIPGMRPKKVASFGAQVLALVHQHA